MTRECSGNNTRNIMTAKELDEHLDKFISMTYQAVNKSKVDYYFPMVMTLGDNQGTFHVIEDFEGSHDEFCDSMVELGKVIREKRKGIEALLLSTYGSTEEDVNQIQIFGITSTGLSNCAVLEVIEKRASLFSRKNRLWISSHEEYPVEQFKNMHCRLNPAQVLMQTITSS
jgi:hypothetical protein